MQSPSSDTGVAKSRACVNCSRAKAKCIFQSNDMSSQQCARCFRLQKDCVVQPRAKRKKRVPNVAGTAELQSKIESLFNLLSATQVAKLGQSEDNGVPGTPGVNISEDFPSSNFGNNFARESRPSQPNSVGTSVPGSIPVTTPLATIPRNDTPAETASTQNSNLSPAKSPDELLRVFRAEFTVQFPYAIISPNVNAIELHDKQPWLYKMIMMAASSHERHRQIETGKLLISELSIAMLTRGEKSLDMLQALLVHASWSHCFAAVLPQVQSTGIVQLVIALTYDLALNRSFRYDGETARLVVEAAKKMADEKRNNPREAERSLDECRALLYAFYLSSTISTCIRKADGLQFSPYMDYCCKMLLESAECEVDLILVACVRFQSIADSIHRALPYRLSNSDGRNAPIWMHTGHLQQELQSIFNGLSSDLQNNVITRLSYHSVEIFLIEAAILETWNVQTFNLRRIDLRWSCLMASKSLLDVFSTVPSSAYHAVSILSLSQISFCLITLFKLAFVDDPGWDLLHVRETANLASYFDHFASGLEQAGSAIDSAQNSPTKESFPTVCARAMIWARGWYDSKVASGPEAGRPLGQQSISTMASSYDMLNDNTFDCMDETYWQELIADFNCVPMQHFSSKDVD